VNRFIYHPHVVTTNNYNIIAISTLSLLSLLSVVIAWWQVSTVAIPLQNFSLVTNLSDGDSSASVVRLLTLHHWTLNSNAEPNRTEPNRTTVRLLLYRLGSEPTESTCHVSVHGHWPVTKHWTWRGPHRKHLLLSACMFIYPLPSTGYGANHIENGSSNTFSIVACAYFWRCLEWVYMSQYLYFLYMN
jgi:hypothetical protein